MTVEQLNAAVCDGTLPELIRVCEARQVKALSKIADQVTDRGKVRLVLLAGGSSSGKTTTAMRLATQLRVNGHSVLALSTDDYFVGDARNPRDENGNLDYEHVNCVDIPALVADLKELFAGKAVRHRIFDFAAHAPAWRDDKLHLPDNGVVILEGIHALNPLLSEGLADELKFRLSIDPIPSIEFVQGLRAPSSYARLLRRIVRDNRYRKTDPARTFELWPNVLAGEKKWIDPFRANADAFFNSYLDYEIAVLKPYVGGLVELARRKLGDDQQILQIIEFLRFVVPATGVTVPGDSILRETIGGSQLDY